jgi:hypothetical protein
MKGRNIHIGVYNSTNYYCSTVLLNNLPHHRYRSLHHMAQVSLEGLDLFRG